LAKGQEHQQGRQSTDPHLVTAMWHMHNIVVVGTEPRK